MRKLLLLLLLPFLFTYVSAQELDTVKMNAIIKMQNQFDSARLEMQKFHKELRQYKLDFITENISEINYIKSQLKPQRYSMSPYTQLSRHRNVNSLLATLDNRPGKIYFNGSTVGIVQSIFKDEDNINTASGSFDLFMYSNLGDNILIFVDMEAVGGNGPDYHINPFTTLNTDAGSTQSADGLDRVHILEAWAEYAAFDERLIITTGKIDLTNYFDINSYANDENSQFLSNAFVNNASLIAPGNAPGVRVYASPIHHISIEAGLSSTENTGDSLFTDIYKIGSIGVSYWEETSNTFEMRLYCYQHPSISDSYGYGVSINQSINDKIAIFGRYGQNEDKLSSLHEIKSSWSTGFQYSNKLFEKDLVVGAAYGISTPYSNSLNNEKNLEIYARQEINKWIHFSPIFQQIWNAGGSSNNFSIIGLRTSFEF